MIDRDLSGVSLEMIYSKASRRDGQEFRSSSNNGNSHRNHCV